MSTKRLPSMEEPNIEELNELAESYVKYRDKRMQIGEKEVELKQKILALMEKSKLDHYKHDHIEITVTVEEKGVRVKALKDDPDGDQ
jgi:hypothetical protein